MSLPRLEPYEGESDPDVLWRILSITVDVMNGRLRSYPAAGGLDAGVLDELQPSVQLLTDYIVKMHLLGHGNFTKAQLLKMQEKLEKLEGLLRAKSSKPLTNAANALLHKVKTVLCLVKNYDDDSVMAMRSRFGRKGRSIKKRSARKSTRRRRSSKAKRSARKSTRRRSIKKRSARKSTRRRSIKAKRSARKSTRRRRSSKASKRRISRRSRR